MERSLSFNSLEIPIIKTKTDSDFEVLETEKSTPNTLDGRNCERIQSPRESFLFYSPRPVNELDAAATMIQKVYKSFRTRRYLEECAIIIEEIWRKSLDDAAPKPVNDLDAAATMIQKVYKKRNMKPDTDKQGPIDQLNQTKTEY